MITSLRRREHRAFVKPQQASPPRVPHPATVTQARPPHPATVVQRRAPHPATVVQRRAPHPAETSKLTPAGRSYAAQPMKRTAARSDDFADTSAELGKIDRTLRWSTEQKAEILLEAEVYEASYRHLSQLLENALEARGNTFDKRHKISYETARDLVVQALQTDDFDLLNGLLVATGNLQERRLTELPTKTAADWTKWITATVNNPLNVYLGLSKYNSKLGGTWDPRQRGNEFGTSAPLDRFEPGSPITEWQVGRVASLLQPKAILHADSILAAAWAIHDHYEILSKMEGDGAGYFSAKLELLPHESWKVTESRVVEADDDDFVGFRKLFLKDRPS